MMMTMTTMIWRSPSPIRNTDGYHETMYHELAQCYGRMNKWPSPQSSDYEVELAVLKVTCCNDKSCDGDSDHRKICKVLLVCEASIEGQLNR